MEWVLDWRSPWLTEVMKVWTDIGSEVFFLAALPLGYWLDSRTRWARIGLAFMLAGVLNAALKDYFQAPRPMLDPLINEGGYSFPSGHAMMSAAFWGAVAWGFRKWWLSAIAVVIVGGIMFSRVYLGVHWPRDVLVGATLGLSIVGLGALFVKVDGPAKLRALGLPLAWLPAGLVVLGAAFLPDPEHHGLKSAAAMAGLWAGVLWVDARAVPPVRRGRRHEAVMLGAGVLGFVGLIAIWAGGKKLLLALDALNTGTAILRYGLVGLWAAALAPLTFERLGWTARPQDSTDAGLESNDPRD